MHLQKQLSAKNFGMPLVRQYLDGFWQKDGFIQKYADFLLTEADPILSRRQMRARVIDIVCETDDAKTYLLRPSKRWHNFEAGMHLQICVEINGVQTRRYYSVSSSPQQYAETGTFSITVKRIAGGKVSNWLYDHLTPGQFIQVAQPSGEFCLSRATADQVLFLAAGSGITPIKSMLETHLAQQSQRQFTLIYYCCNPAEVIFARQLKALADQHANFSLAMVHTDTDGLICANQLNLHCSELAARDVFLCGPGGFMQAATQLLQAQGVPAERIHQESFGVRLSSAVSAEAGAQVHFTRAGVESESKGDQTILTLAEAAGLSPKYGCRSGICHECKCMKRSGQVMNVLTGQISTAENEAIQACISVPQGKVEVDL